MRVRFTQSMASADWSYVVGQVVEVGTEYSERSIPKEQAAACLSSGLVVPDEDEPEVAVRTAPENASRRKPGPRGGAA